MNNFDIFYLSSYIAMMGGIFYYAIDYLQNNTFKKEYDLYLPSIPDGEWFTEFCEKNSLLNKNVGVMVDNSVNTLLLLSYLKENFIDNGHTVYAINTNCLDSDYLEEVCVNNGFEYVEDIFYSLSTSNEVSKDRLLDKYNASVLNEFSIDSCFMGLDNDYFSKNLIDNLFFNRSFSKTNTFVEDDVSFYLPFYHAPNSIIKKSMEEYNMYYKFDIETPETEYFKYLDMDSTVWRTNLFKLYMTNKHQEQELNDDIDSIYDTRKVFKNGSYIKFDELDYIPMWLIEMILHKLHIKISKKTLGVLYNRIKSNEPGSGELNDDMRYYYSNGLCVFHNNIIEDVSHLIENLEDLEKLLDNDIIITTDSEMEEVD